MRTCVGCRQTAERSDLIRLVVGDDGRVVADLRARAFGRGAWVHPRASCLSQATKKGLARSLKVAIASDTDAVFAEVRGAADRRVEALLASARASGKAAVGSDAAGQAVATHAAKLLIVAADARASSQALPPEAASRSVIWGDKLALGAALGRGETGVVAVLDSGLSDAIRRTVALSTLSPSDASLEGTPARLEVR